MSVRFLVGRYDVDRPAAVMVDSVTETPFGPLFHDQAEAEEFIATLREDPRIYDDETLAGLLTNWRRRRGEVIR